MFICPKLGERNQEINPLLIPYLADHFEIQMTTKDLDLSLNRCKNVIMQAMRYTHVKEVVLHMPFTLHTFELFVASRHHAYILFHFIKDVESISRQFSINIGLLFHQEHSVELVSTIPHGIEKISDFVSYPESGRVFFLLENCLPCLNDFDTHTVPAFSLLKMIPNDNLYSCIDICHIRCYENIFNMHLPIPTEISSRVRWVHFSYTGKKDGYKDKCTHSITHKSSPDMLSDMFYLAMNGIDIGSTPIICEISETDYDSCPNTRKEIDLLRSLETVYCISA